MEVGKLMKNMAMYGAGQLYHHPLRTSILFASAANSLQAFEHIQIRQDMTEEDAIEWAEDALDMDEFQATIDEEVDKLPKEHIKPLARSIVDSGKTFYAQFDEWLE